MVCSRLPLLAAAFVCQGLVFISSSGLSAGEYLPPEGYYDGAEGLVGTALREVLHEAIDGHRNLGYDAMRIAPRVLDADPETADNIILIYSGASVAGFRFNSSWNREHTWPQSFGADSYLMPGADFHHLFPANPTVNSARSNLIFDWTSPGESEDVYNAPGSTMDSNSFEPRDEDKGRVARAMLYMDLRYEASDGFGDFQLAETANQATKRMAKLSVLLEWNRLFPPDERELRRNHLIHNGFPFAGFTYTQGNRNPFVDFPDIADALFTHSERMAWGTWRWTHFSLEQLQAGTQTGPLDDPDEDFLPNLLEYSANLDPLAPQSANLLTVFRLPGFGTQLRYTRQAGASADGIRYAIQRSGTPLREESWVTLEDADFTSQTVSGSGLTELVTALVPPSSDPVWYRLAVTQTLGAGSTQAVFDPVRTPEGSESLFVYDAEIQSTGWKESPWMGYVSDSDYPWVYHVHHRWLYFSAEQDDQVWYLDSQLGWCFTSSAFYPNLYHVGSDQWLYYLKASTAPNRWFHAAGQGWVQESEILSTLTQ